MKALRTLLEGAIDYAGLFPPASLAMPEVIRNYATYREGPDAWALGRFIVPLARLREVEGKPWRFSLPAAPGDALPAGAAYTVEIKANRAEQIQVPAGVTAYFETPEELIPAIGAAGGRGKIRMGGDSVPDSPAVARFMALCANARIGFKATAGLHHPIRSAGMHGFLNTLVAACLIHHGGDESIAVEILEERDPEAFRFDDSHAAWRDQHFTIEQIADGRAHFIDGFGSCSFEEPLADLRQLGLL